MSRFWRFSALLGLLLGSWALVTLNQRQSAATLQAEIESRRAERDARDRLAAENARLRAKQISSAELEVLRRDHIALRRLREEIETSRVQAEKAKQTAVAQLTPPLSPHVAAPSITEEFVPVEMWKNAGSATPIATVETELWAAAGGDVELVGQNLILAGEAKTKADSLWAGLSPAVRNQFGSQERLIASLTAKDVPLGDARLMDPKAEDQSDVKILAQVGNSKIPSKAIFFTLREEAGTWKIVVPVSAVEKYARALNSPPR